MSTPYQEQLLEWHTTGQLALIDVARGTVKRVGSPAMIRAIDLAPDGKFVRVTRMPKPFSYVVPVANFGSIEEIWDDTGKALAKLSDRPINLGGRPTTRPQPDPAQAAAGGGGGGGAIRPASARSPGAPTARASRTSSRSPDRRPREGRGGAGGRGAGRRR